MFTSLSRCDRAAAGAGFLFLAAYVALASSAAASEITYSIVDYPANEGVVSGMGTDRISGTIVTDGAIGPISAMNIIGGTLAFTDPKGDVVAGAATIDSPVDLRATPTELLLTSGLSFSIHATQREPHTTDGVDAASVTYKNYASNSQYYGQIGTSTPVPSVLSSFNSAPVSTGPGSIGSSSDWVVAAVPETDDAALGPACPDCVRLLSSPQANGKRHLTTASEIGHRAGLYGSIRRKPRTVAAATV